jgi:hypothetical protein
MSQQHIGYVTIVCYSKHLSSGNVMRKFLRTAGLDNMANGEAGPILKQFLLIWKNLQKYE